MPGYALGDKSPSRTVEELEGVQRALKEELEYRVELVAWHLQTHTQFTCFPLNSSVLRLVDLSVESDELLRRSERLTGQVI